MIDEKQVFFLSLYYGDVNIALISTLEWLAGVWYQKAYYLHKKKNNAIYSLIFQFSFSLAVYYIIMTNCLKTVCDISYAFKFCPPKYTETPWCKAWIFLPTLSFVCKYCLYFDVFYMFSSLLKRQPL